MTRIRNVDHRLSINPLSGNDQSPPIGHSIDGVQEKVHKNLLKKVGIPIDPYGTFRKVCRYLDSLNLYLVFDQRQRFFEHSNQINLRHIRSGRSTTKLQEILDDD